MAGRIAGRSNGKRKKGKPKPLHAGRLTNEELEARKRKVKKPRLTQQQRNFCEFYLISGNTADAMRKAGYAESTVLHKSGDILKNPLVKAYMSKLSRKATNERIMDITQRKEALSEIAAAFKVDGAIDNERASLAIKALDVLNKMDGVYVQNVNAKVENVTPVVIVDDIALRSSTDIEEVQPPLIETGD